MYNWPFIYFKFPLATMLYEANDCYMTWPGRSYKQLMPRRLNCLSEADFETCNFFEKILFKFIIDRLQTYVFLQKFARSNARGRCAVARILTYTL